MHSRGGKGPKGAPHGHNVSQSSGEDKNPPDAAELESLMQQMIDWALSSLNKSRDELIDVCFVIYLEFYVKLFKNSVQSGVDFLNRFSIVFEEKFGHFIKQLLEIKFVTQLPSSPVLKFSDKHLVILTKRTRKLLEDWLDRNETSPIGHAILTNVEFIDGEALNHQNVHIYKRHFIAKYGLDPESVLKYRRPFLGLYIKDFDNEIKVANAKNQLVLGGPSPDVPLGLPFELYAEDPHADNHREPMETISGEVAILEDARHLVPLPRPGTNLYNSIRAGLFAQVGNRLVDKNMGLCYTFQNAPHAFCCSISAIDGRFAALGGSDGGILLWDLVGGETANAQRDLVPIVGEALATKSISANSLDDSTGSSLLSGHDGSVLSLCFGEDGRVVLSGGVDGQIRLWTLFGTRATRAIYHGSNSAVLSLDYGPFGYYFASSGADGSAKLWATDRSFPLRILRTVHADVLGAIFHPNSSLLCTASTDGTLRLWDLRSSCCDVVLQAHVPSDVKAAFAFSKNGQYLASASNNTIHVFDLYTRKRMQILPGHQEHIRAISFAYGTRTLAACDRTCISLWNLDQNATKDETVVEHKIRMQPGFEKLMLDGPFTLNSAFTMHDVHMASLAYTPENVLLALGLSTLGGVES
ncbi:bifunctional WD40 repeat/G-protein beta WD-40 repeat/TFIID subunit TAF5 [Babesia duncani]|uniref:Bifunctional WD40 repeat/G-protein beta WD-40 repeat/TFIID subunit TAF5 n=1 Tax=Babesia duncani TaxID=323732 RepID=A0AAD9PLP0_9APIC|nr:bifunctional WD40 repeat/G-protein beta WD-40 repeat/TFIID subunit TAF5 [Babesia duncani]